MIVRIYAQRNNKDDAIMAKISQLNAETSELLSIYSLCNNETSDQSSETNKEEDKQ